MELIDQTIDISTDEYSTIRELLDQHLPGIPAWVYGSRVKWTSSPTSDLDLVVFASPEQQHLVHDLQEAFEESDLLFRVDLFVWNDLPQAFKERIKEKYVVLS
ncbi:MAG: nucleotidyltransferase domain-containing protein [Bacteroidetes bacterium]|nr:nucleotidyltransferase domain-containing protein [Bacteroidota bacterium]MCY4206137.1 nucleotidyltransferase domain-containing protein [Bacteroidota bacterium]